MAVAEPTFTIGIEEEYLLVDRTSRDLVREIPEGLFKSAQNLLDEQVSSAIDLVAAKRLAVDIAAPSFVVITVGVLAAGSLDAKTDLGEAVVRDCEFQGFTFAT